MEKNTFDWLRKCNAIALRVIDIHFSQDFHHVRMFDRFGDCLDLHHMTDVVNRFDQGAMSRVLRESLNELAIDLDEIDGESSQVGE